MKTTDENKTKKKPKKTETSWEPKKTVTRTILKEKRTAWMPEKTVMHTVKLAKERPKKTAKKKLKE